MEGGKIMFQQALLFLFAILAGFALIVVTGLTGSFLISWIISKILIAIGTLAVIFFSLALLLLAVKSLLKKHRK